MSSGNAKSRNISRGFKYWFATRSLTVRMLLAGLPLLAGVLAVLFGFAAKSAESAIDRAIKRSAQLQAQALGMQLEHILNQARNQLMLLATGPIQRDAMLALLSSGKHMPNFTLREVAFMGVDPSDRYLFVNHNGEIVPVPPVSARDVASGPFQGLFHKEDKGHVSVSRPLEVSYPLVPIGGAPQTVAFHGLRLSTPIYDDENIFLGILSVCLDLAALRRQLSLRAGQEDSTPGRSFFFDQDGWMLFQSESADGQNRPLGSDNVRDGFRGDFGRPGFSAAFRPAPEHLNYWTMVSEVQAGKSGILPLPAMDSVLNVDQDLAGAVSFTPVSFITNDAENPVIIGGLGMLDPDFTGTGTGRKLFGIYSFCMVCGILLPGITLWLIARSTSKKLCAMADEIRQRNEGDSEEALPMRPQPLELEKIRNQVDCLLGRLNDKKQVLASQSRARTAQWMAEPIPVPAPLETPQFCALVGQSQVMQRLNAQIHKAAQADCDILITGETGTGKELVSESIHRLSNRHDGPFISINCGALDEALLMDTLFGHVKGAFTEAKSPRKGAFLAACKGTLLLDEIGNASPKVQQALLRALSTRRIHPLGSDEDVPFDTRIIAATNSHLHDGVQDFRNDLYYRLAVITIETPPLRQRLEDIQDLALHFMRLANNSGSPLPDLSRGALEKLLTHSWPGNVRELKNVITRAMAFCNGMIIYAQDLEPGIAGTNTGLANGSPIDLPGALPAEPAPGKPAEKNRLSTGEKTPLHPMLNGRLRRLWPQLARLESISRHEYQVLAGEGISARTAQYDLGQLVRLGLMRRDGRGPSLRYLPVTTS